MSQSNEPPNQVDTTKQLELVEADLGKQATSARRRIIITRIVALALIVFMAAYLGYAYQQIGKLDTVIVGSATQHVIEDNLPGLRRDLGRTLKERAPEFVDKLEKVSRDLPKKMEAELKKAVLNEIRKRTLTLEKDVGSGLQTLFEETRKQAGNKKLSEAEAMQRIDQAAAQCKTEAKQLIDKVHKDYVTKSTDIRVYLELLAGNKDLDKRQKIARDAFITLFALMAKMAKGKEGATPETIESLFLTLETEDKKPSAKKAPEKKEKMEKGKPEEKKDVKEEKKEKKTADK